MSNSNKITEQITIQSPDFGELEIQPNNIFYFEYGLLGFENLNNFVLITDDDIVPFKWLMSIEEPSIMFPLISPLLIVQDYNAGKDIDEDQVIFAVVTLNDGSGNITANLKAPVILHSSELTGEQRILTTDKYDVNHIMNNTPKEV
jgi:flagellar assembly factor FliW